MTINRKQLYTLYMAKVSEICETNDWKTQFGPEEIVNLIADIIEEDNGVVESGCNCC